MNKQKEKEEYTGMEAYFKQVKPKKQKEKRRKYSVKELNEIYKGKKFFEYYRAKFPYPVFSSEGEIKLFLDYLDFVLEEKK